MIYIYNSNTKFQKQIQYAFINIFYVLGLDYAFLNNSFDNKLGKEDILINYTDGELGTNQEYKSKNVIIINPSNKLFNENYLNIDSIPTIIKKYSNIISIFSEDADLYIKEDFKDVKVIDTNIDIVSDIFFMLTRYEEVVNTKAYENEPFNRFLSGYSLANKNGFLNRPIVNEHIDLMWSFITKFSLGYQKKKWWGDKDFAACITHDVDMLQRYKKLRNILRTTASLLLKDKQPKKAASNFINYLKGYKNDPLYNFDYIINTEKLYGFKSSYYFMSGGNSEFDNSYDINEKKVTKLISQIENEKLEVGYHGSFNSYNNFEILNKEKEKIDKLINKKKYGCRQHFLRFKVPYTWIYQEKAGLLYDATLSFADAEGFRCGTCFPFKPYDLIENRIINLWEIPLIVMEASLVSKNYRAYDHTKGLEEIMKLIDVVKKYNGVFTILWHNSSFDPSNEIYYGWKEVYERTMKYLSDDNCIGTSGIEIIEMISGLQSNSIDLMRYFEVTQ